MDDAFGSGLDALGAEVNRCERVAGAAGDPAMSAFREAVSQGAIPFSVQGPANAWCLDGGRTIGWELHDQLNDVEVAPQAVFVQVGGGALATSLALGLGDDVPLVVVQARAAHPLNARCKRHLELMLQNSIGPNSCSRGSHLTRWPTEFSTMKRMTGSALGVPLSDLQADLSSLLNQRLSTLTSW